MQRFRGGLALKAHRLCISLNSRLESNEEEEEEEEGRPRRIKVQGAALSVEDLNKDLKQGSGFMGYRGTSLKRNNLPLGPNSRPMSRALWWY